MITIVTVDGKEEEIPVLKGAISESAAYLTDEHWEKKFFSKVSDMNAYLETEPLMDFGCFDVTVDGVIKGLGDMRSGHEDMGMLLIADTSVSPVEYLKPGIRADSLIMRPFESNELKKTMNEFISSGLNRMNRNEDSEDQFVLKTKEGRTFIPYDNIFYFEAREKKLFIRLLNEEYSFYSTIDEMEATLPKQFARCHRSFIVNMNRLKRLVSSENILELQQDFVVPISRSYKKQIKEWGGM